MEFDKKYSLIILSLFIFFMFYKPIFCFLILGTLAFYHGFSRLMFLDYIEKNGIESIGKILSYESGEDGHKTPIVEFKTIEGDIVLKKPYCYVSTDLSMFKSYQDNINKNVTIIYSLKNPEKFVLKTEKDFNYGGNIILIIISLIFLGFAIGDILGFIQIDI